MATVPKVREGLTLEEFLGLPEIDERPYLEFIDGRVEAKVSPQRRHSVLTKELVAFFDQHARPRGLGEAFPELRCTFAGRSIVPDVVFLLAAQVVYDERGELADVSHCTPDVQIEIISPRQSLAKARKRLAHTTAHGCPLGILINPMVAGPMIEVFRPGRPPERIAEEGAIDMAPVLPGRVLPAGAVFDWLRRGPRTLGPS